MASDERTEDGSDETRTSAETHGGSGAAIAPNRLGEFTLLEELGRGGMGVVYRWSTGTSSRPT